MGITTSNIYDLLQHGILFWTQLKMAVEINKNRQLKTLFFDSSCDPSRPIVLIIW